MLAAYSFTEKMFGRGILQYGKLEGVFYLQLLSFSRVKEAKNKILIV